MKNSIPSKQFQMENAKQPRTKIKTAWDWIDQKAMPAVVRISHHVQTCLRVAEIFEPIFAGGMCVWSLAKQKVLTNTKTSDITLCADEAKPSIISPDDYNPYDGSSSVYLYFIDQRSKKEYRCHVWMENNDYRSDNECFPLNPNARDNKMYETMAEAKQAVIDHICSDNLRVNRDDLLFLKQTSYEDEYPPCGVAK